MSPPPLPRAQFERRAAAWCIDALILVPLGLLLAHRWWQPDLIAYNAAVEQLRDAFQQTLIDAADAGADPTTLLSQLTGTSPLRVAIHALAASLTTFVVKFMVAYAALALPWHLLGERSSWRGSFGKHLLGLRVLRADGKAASTATLLLRHLASGLSWLTLNLGHLMALRPPFATLHDALAGTAVTSTRGSLPTWARLLLWILASVGVVLPLLWALQLGARISAP